MTKFFKLLSILMVLFINVSLFAQGAYEITGSETWSTNKQFNVPVIVKSGGKLTIEAGVIIEVFYADANADGIGDFKLQVEDGGKLIINGTLSSPVVFQPKEIYPVNNHWQGIILNSTNTNYRDTIKFVTIKNAYVGLDVSRDLYAIGVKVQNSYNTGVKINNFNSLSSSFYHGIKIDTVYNSGTGISIAKEGITINNAYVQKATGVGIELKAGSLTINNSKVLTSGTGIYNNVANTFANLNTVQESYIYKNTKSGVFNKGGYIKIYKDSIASNTFHGILTNGGKLLVELSTIHKNSSRGVLVGGASEVNFITSTVDSNSSYGFDICEVNLATDQLYSTITGTSVGAPKIIANLNNIKSNNGGNTQVQVKSRRTTPVSPSNPQDDFTQNYWYLTETLDGLFSMDLSGTINYWNWKTSSSPTSNSKFPTSTVTNPTTMLALLNTSGNGSGTIDGLGTTTSNPTFTSTISARGGYTLRWNSAKHYPFVRIKIDTTGATDAGTSDANYTSTRSILYVPNNGSYEIQVYRDPYPTTSGSLWDDNYMRFTVTLYDYDGNASTYVYYGYQDFVNYNANRGKVISVNGVSTGTAQTIYSGKPIKIKWTVIDSAGTNVNIYYKRRNMDLRAANSLTIGNANCAVDLIASNVNTKEVNGEYLWTPPTDTLTTGINNAVGKIVIVRNFGTTPTTVSGANIVDTANTASITLEPAPYADWLYTDSTGVSQTIIIKDAVFNLNAAPGNGTIRYNGDLLGTGPYYYRVQVGDYVGAFYNGGQNCAGFVKVTTVPDGTLTNAISLQVWGDDPNTSVTDGASAGEQLTFKVWRPRWFRTTSVVEKNAEYDINGKIIPVDSVVYPYKNNAVTGIVFQNNSAIILDSLRYLRGSSSASTEGTGSQTVALSSGWNLVSSYIDVAGLTVAFDKEFRIGSNKATGVLDTLGEVCELVKDPAANILWPAQNVDQLGTWVNTSSYYIKLTAAANLIFPRTGNGNILSPQNTGITLQPGVWNQVAYLRKTNMNISDALVNILDKIELVKDGAGNVYWPLYGINNIGQMQPGQGYLIKTKSGISQVSLFYPANTLLPKKQQNVEIPKPEKYVVNFNSDNNATVAIPENVISKYAKEGDEVGIFNNEGKLVGSAVYTNGTVVVTAWGKETGNEKAEGLANGDKFSIRLFKKDANKEFVLKTTTSSDKVYTPNGVYVIENVKGVEEFRPLPDKFDISQNYPNPFNPTTTIKFALPVDAKVVINVYNVVGQKVAELANGEFEAGYHTVQFNAAGLSSGIYFYKIEAGKFTAVKKMMLIK